MDADGANVRRLTHAPGYDGGPFYSADGGKIVWRRFGEDGHSAEIYVMNADGTGEKAITALGALSWAPYFHPSGRYIIFGTSVQGFQNFELYMVDTEGNNDPVRVTETAGFDSLPVFSPDGATLSWTSSRTADKKPQIFLARWNHEAALAALGVDGATPKAAEGPDLPATQAKVRADDMRRHVEALASPAMEGRLTGSEGERLATDYVARAFARLGLAPAGDDGTYFQAFEFTSGVRLGTGNGLKISGADAAPVVEKSWRPLGLSANGSVAASPVVFAGYGIVAPAAKGIPAYDSYADLDVAGKWVMVLRYLPSGITQDRRRHMDRYAELNYKVAVARDRGAVGMIVVSGPASGVNEQLIPLHLDAAASGSGLAAITVTDSLAEALLAGAGKSLAALDQAVNDGEAVAGFALPDVALAAHIDLVRETATGRNALARLAAGDGAAAETVIVGAHVDHLGRGVEGKSRARPEERGQVHPGADDNASGVAGLLEIAEYLSDLKARGRLGARRDILFAAWSGEELGLLGSDHFVETLGAGRDSLRPEIAAYLNMDMIGRLDEQLILQGVGSSPAWRGEIERRNAPIGLSLRLDDSAFLPTDATSFYLKGVPILNAFTGPHDEYSTPRDRPETLNHEGAARIARFMGLVARGLAATESPPAYTAHKGPAPTFRRRTSRAYMGTIPDYAGAEGKGARLSGVSEGGPAAKAGLKAGDVVVAPGRQGCRQPLRLFLRPRRPQSR